MPDDDFPTAVPAPAAGPFRASDADRHRTVEVLQDAVGRGLLSTDEGGERMAAAYAARYLHELPALTADLPPAPVPAPAPPGWGPLAGLAVLQARSGLSALTADGLRSRRVLAMAAGLLVVLLTMLALAVAGLHLLIPDPHGYEQFGPRS